MFSSGRYNFVGCDHVECILLPYQTCPRPANWFNGVCPRSTVTRRRQYYFVRTHRVPVKFEWITNRSLIENKSARRIRFVFERSVRDIPFGGSMVQVDFAARDPGVTERNAVRNNGSVASVGRSFVNAVEKPPPSPPYARYFGIFE